MKSFPLHYIVIGLIVTGLAGALVSARSSDAYASTYAALVLLVGGTIAVSWFTWRNGLPTQTVGQLLQRTEATPRNDGSQ